MLDRPAQSDVAALLAAIEGLRQDVAELRADGAVLRDEVRNALVCLFQPGDGISVAQAAELAGRSGECIRGWVTKHRIGLYYPATHKYTIFESKLRAFYLKQFGRPLPDNEK